MQPDTRLFATNYTSARARFLEIAANANAGFETYRHPSATGPQGEALHVDIARVGNDNPDRVLLISSGVHGIEGYLGSATQAHALAQGVFTNLPPDLAVVMVHAVNPHGFAHERRCNEDGIDLNRNFLNWNESPPAEHEHTGWLMERLFVPHPKPAEVEAFIAQHGKPVYTKALVQGQCRFPLGVCYGGTGYSWSNKLWSLVRGRHADVPEIVHIDLHSGYGPVAGAVVLPADYASAADIARTKEWWGDRVEGEASGTAASLANVRGPIECSFLGRNGAALSSTIESGTIPFEAVLATLVADHQRVAAGEPVTPASRAAMRAAYAPEDAAWQRSAVEAFTQVLADGLAGMRREGVLAQRRRLALAP